MGMTAWQWTALIAAGGLGTVARYGVDLATLRLLGGRFPWGTSTVNISGAFLLGLLTAAALPEAWAPIVGIGFLGAYTTFSTWMIQSYELADGDEKWRAVANIVIPMVAGLAAAAIGLWLGGYS